MMASSHKIFLCAGGTAGHVYPAIFTAQILKQRGYTPIIITDIRGFKYCQDINDIKIIIIYATSPAQPSLVKKLKALFLLMFGVMQSLWLMLIHRPAMLVGFGGYLSMPILCAGIIMRILTRRKMILHEQNAVLGKVNRLWAKFSIKIALSFQHTSLLKKQYLNKSIYIGNPVRHIFYDYQTQPKPTSELFNILVFGGSQGAKTIAKNINDIFTLLAHENLNDIIHFTIQAPALEIEILQKTAQQYNINATIAEFFDDLPKYMWQADLVIARAGASTIFELKILNKNAILIPLAIAADNHQYHNAKSYAETHHATIIEESDVSPTILWQEIKQSFDNQKLLASPLESHNDSNIEKAEEKLASLIIEHINI